VGGRTACGGAQRRREGLRGGGITARIGGRATDPWLRPEGTRLRLAGTSLAAPVVVESFNYDLTDMGQQASKLAEADAARVVLSGPTRPAHVFRRHRVVLLYRGADRTALAVLTDLLGAEVARRP